MTGRVAAYLRFERADRSIDALDGLRALAILLVLGRHAVVPFWTPGEPLLPVAGWDLALPLINGWVGVDLFFVLSGFLIARQICRRYGHGRMGAEMRDYLFRRIFRIVPAYYAVLFVVVFGWVPFYQASPDAIEVRVAYHMLFLQDVFPSNIVVPFWSLGVEEKFYLVAPFLVLSALALPWRGARYGLIALCVALPILFRTLIHLDDPGVESYSAFFSIFRSPFYACFEGLAVGVLCAFAFRDRPMAGPVSGPRPGNPMFWAGTALVAALLGGQALLDTIGLFDKLFLQTVLALGFGAMVMGALWGGGPQRLLGSRVGLFFSKISYSLYLVHWALVPLSRHLLAMMVDTSDLPRAVAFALFFVVFGCVSVAGALVLHYAVEKPFLLLRGRFVARPQTVSMAPAVSA